MGTLSSLLTFAAVGLVLTILDVFWEIHVLLVTVEVFLDYQVGLCVFCCLYYYLTPFINLANFMLMIQRVKILIRV